MRELDDARGPGYVPPASGVEARFLEITHEPWIRQVDLGNSRTNQLRVAELRQRFPALLELLLAEARVKRR